MRKLAKAIVLLSGAFALLVGAPTAAGAAEPAGASSAAPTAAAVAQASPSPAAPRVRYGYCDTLEGDTHKHWVSSIFETKLRKRYPTEHLYPFDEWNQFMRSAYRTNEPGLCEAYDTLDEAVSAQQSKKKEFRRQVWLIDVPWSPQHETPFPTTDISDYLKVFRGHPCEWLAEAVKASEQEIQKNAGELDDRERFVALEAANRAAAEQQCSVAGSSAPAAPAPEPAPASVALGQQSRPTPAAPASPKPSAPSAPPVDPSAQAAPEHLSSATGGGFTGARAPIAVT
jgi:hypothetical protein